MRTSDTAMARRPSMSGRYDDGSEEAEAIRAVPSVGLSMAAAEGPEADVLKWKPKNALSNTGGRSKKTKTGFWEQFSLSLSVTRCASDAEKDR